VPSSATGRRYATAAFNVAAESGDFDGWLNTLNEFARIMQMPSARTVFMSPAVPTSQKRAALDKLLVNATPLGRRDEMPLRPNALPREGGVVDLVYVEGGTPLVRKARSLGLRTADGWGILLSQGARSFETWTGKTAPLEAMRQTLPQ